MRYDTLGLGIGCSGPTETALLRTMLNGNIINLPSYHIYLNDYDFDNNESTFGAVDGAKYNGNSTTFEFSSTTAGQLDNLQYKSAVGGGPEALPERWNSIAAWGLSCILGMGHQQDILVPSTIFRNKSELKSSDPDGFAPTATVDFGHLPTAAPTTGPTTGSAGGRIPTGFPKWAPAILALLTLICGGGVIFV
ncbi:hypothetical protein ABW20_dc0107481 [Dactylellina cionopaga]|nr:hypothetical protein ABW20_dc0107481 [Dactylellina cionopaga]